MDTVKIGEFIAGQRKAQKLTQMELAEKLNVTDRAVSKWECGRSMPDSSIMLKLCEILKISVNELLTGEKLDMENYNEKAEQNLIELKKQKEQSDKRLLQAEIWIGLFAGLFLLAVVAIASFVDMKEWARITLILVGLVIFLIVCFIC